MSDKINESVMGVLIKHSAINVKENVLVQTQIKCTDFTEVRGLVDALTKYGVEDLSMYVPAYDARWSKVCFSLSEYNLYFNITFGADMYTDEGGEQFHAKLDSMSITKKMKDESEVYECVLTFLKNADEEINDMRFNAIYLKYKEADPTTGKKALKSFKVKLDQCDGFMLGSAKSDDDEDGTVVELNG